MPPTITANTAILMEATTGRVIYDLRAEEQRYPASMTKMMTAILALEEGSPGHLVKISPQAAATEDTGSGIQVGETLALGELLKSLMIISDNGAAVAIAQDIGGSVPRFAVMMNDKARKIGCTSTHFNNPNGLPDSNHYSTALDMGKIAAYGMKNKDFRRLAASRHAILYWHYPPGKTLGLENTNLLLGEYEGTEGIKTGWTNAAGGCLAAAAKRGNTELIAVVMGSSSGATRFSDAEKLLDYGFSRVRVQQVAAKERVNKSVWVKDGLEYKVTASPDTDVSYVLIGEETAADYKLRFDMEKIVKAPVTRGQILGYLIEECKGQEVSRIPMCANDDVPEGFSFWSKILVGMIAFWLE